MSVIAAVLTYRPQTTGRLDALVATVESLAEADAVFVVDNGSGPDEVAAIAAALGAEPFTHDHTLHTCGHGTNLQARVLAGVSRFGDICVHSDDDMIWRPGWRARLGAYWQAAPQEVRLTGCHIEPLYAWNECAGAFTIGDERALIRASTGAASWSYRAQDASAIFPIPERVQGTGDVPACTKIAQRGGVICQIDLAEHKGEVSTWGNRTVDLYGWDTAPALALLRGAA